jgi:hypothetical protein
MATWLTNPETITFTAPTDAQYETFDAGAHASWPANGTGVAGIIKNKSTTTDLEIGWRMKGAGTPDDFKFTLLAEFMVGYFCGIDGNDEMEFYCEDWSEVDFYTSFFFGPNAVFFANGKDKSQTTTGSWIEGIDVTAETAAGATHLIALAYPTTDSTNTFGARAGDGTTEIQDNVGRGTGVLIPLQTGELMDMYISSTVLDFKILGYLTNDWTTDSANGTDISVTDGNWTTRSINTNALGTILETEKAGGGGDTLSIRTDDGNTEVSGEVSKTWLPLRCNPDGDIDIQGGSANVNTWWNIYSIAEAAGGNNVPAKQRHYMNRRRAV